MRYVKSTLNRFFKGIEYGEETISSLGLMGATLLVVAQVFNRYFLHLEIMWFSDLALYCATFFLLVTCAVSTAREGNVAVDYFREKVISKEPRAIAIYRVFIGITSIIVLYTFLPAAYEFMSRAMKYPEYGTLVRWFNTSWLQITLFIVAALIFMHLIVIAFRDINDLWGKWHAGYGRYKK